MIDRIIYNAGVCLKIGREAFRAKIYTRFQFKIHLLLQNVLQNLVRSTSKAGFADKSPHKISVLKYCQAISIF